MDQTIPEIKAFYGTSINAVKTQIWIAVCVYLLVTIVKKELKIDRSMGEILQILSIGLFEKTPFLQAFTRERTTISVIFVRLLTGQYCSPLVKLYYYFCSGKNNYERFSMRRC